jgi:hypothetical protein
MDLEAFEKARPPRRSQMDLVLTRGERHRLLVEWGASGQDVIEAIRMIIRVKNQRRQTVNNLGSYDRIEEIFENLSRRMRRAVCQSSSKTEALKLKQQSERIASINTKRKKHQTTSFSGEAASDTATDTATATSSPQVRTGQRATKADGRDSKPPPCKEVSVMKNDSDHSTNSEDAGDFAPPEMKMTLRPVSAKAAAATKQHIEAKGGDHDDTYKHETDNDVDNMSNPQSHDHRETISLSPVPIRAIGGSVDI